MIDLRDRDLPSGIDFGGKFYPLHTDFRIWISFDHDLQAHGVANSNVFSGDVPLSEEALEPLLEFYESPKETPRKLPGDSDEERAIDLVLDGDYIVASFQQAYGIDLTSIEYMHWHRFKALLNGLPDNTVLTHVISCRTYRKRSEKYDQTMTREKSRWRLPEYGEKENQEALDEWAKGLGL